MNEELCKSVDEKIEEILKQGINTQNLDYLYKLTKIKYLIKEEENMYGNYGRRYGNDSYNDSYGYSYGRESYGRRNRYRGHEHLDKTQEDYGRYMDYRGRYGHNEDTDKSFHYMVKSLEDFIKYLFEEADAPQEKQMLRDSLRESIM